MKLTTQVNVLTATTVAGLVAVCAIALSQATGSGGASWILGAGTVAGLACVAGGIMIGRNLAARLTLARSQAEALAALDLSGSHESLVDDEVGELINALNHMRRELAGVVSVVRQNADSVATASAQIAQGNQDLSSRTEQQASSLQETASSMEELGSTVRQNADNASQANQLAQGASAVAARGGNVVAQVVDTMKGINDSSKKIADIISVIDGIAFQTNILALNAAVEAARAGEQGRGFAVVAGEVRSLAQRSAEAAREIKSLITTSVERVEQGTSLVDEAGSTMQEIVTSIQRVSDIIGEISAASTEQSSGVAQVGNAVSVMDQSTQQNAALVEQSAAAAESLKQQAQHLVQAVAVFKVNARDFNSQPASTPTQTPAPASKGIERRMGSRVMPALNKPAPMAASPSPAPRIEPAETRAPQREVKPLSTPKFDAGKSDAASDDWETF